MNYNTIKLNWCERHIIETCFPDLFFSDKSTFYLDNPVGAWWVKSKESYIHTKNKWRKFGHGLQLAQEEKYQCICMNKILIHKII